MGTNGKVRGENARDDPQPIPPVFVPSPGALHQPRPDGRFPHQRTPRRIPRRRYREQDVRRIYPASSALARSLNGGERTEIRDTANLFGDPHFRVHPKTVEEVGDHVDSLFAVREGRESRIWSS